MMSNVREETMMPNVNQEETQVVIFSKDRAMQLDALLRSIYKYAPRYQRNIVVIYRYTTSAFRDGYCQMLSEHKCNATRLVHFVHEGGCGQDDGNGGVRLKTFKECLMTMGFCTSKPLITMLVDDDMFFRPLPEFTVVPGEAYAPRLGYNCTVCYNGGGQAQAVPTKLYRDVGGEGNLDFDCTLCLDGHVYRTTDLVERFTNAEFSNPNELEDKLSGSIRPRLHFAEHSCVVGIPHNIVGTFTSNRNNGGSAAQLNTMFLLGWRIDQEAMDFSDVHSVHQIIPYMFRQIP